MDGSDYYTKWLIQEFSSLVFMFVERQDLSKKRNT